MNRICSRQPLAAALVATALVMMTGCGTTAQKQETSSTKGVVTMAPYVGGAPASQREYLLAIHRRLDELWTRGVLAMCDAMLPPGHPANRRGLMTEIEVKLDWLGQPNGLRIARPSGYAPFDQSALRVMTDLHLLPVLPKGVEGRATLRWRFHRDERSCDPRHARLEVRPLSEEEALERALARGELGRAAELLARSQGKPSLIAIVADAGLSSRDPAVCRAALRLAPSSRAEAILGSTRSRPLWPEAIGVLLARKEAAALTRVAEAAGPRAEAARLVPLLDALRELEGALPEKLAAELLARPERELVLAAAALARSAAALAPALTRWAADPLAAGPLAVRRAHLTGEGLEAVRHALAGAGALPTLQALARSRVKALDADVETLARSAKTPAAARAQAVALVGALKLSIIPLYVALRDGGPEVQIAAARALGAARANKLAVSHRLADLAFKASGAVAAEALAALARVGDERFRPDTVRRMRRLSAREQAVVVSALWGFGPVAVPLLVKLLQHESAAVRAAAAASLARVPGEAAQQALASVRPASSPRQRPAATPLEQLLERAASLSALAKQPRPAQS